MAKKKYSSDEEPVSALYFSWISFRIWLRKNLVGRFIEFRSRRFHRSFRLTRKRDYQRPLKIAGYWSFTKAVFHTISENKKSFLLLMVVIAVANFILVGLLDQDFLNSLKDIANTTNGGLLSGGWGELGKASLVVLSTFSTGGLVRSPNEAQQTTMFLIVMFAWLAVVQLCRNIFSGKKKISVREALYTCGMPIIPMSIIALVILIQAIPAFLSVIIYGSAITTKFASQGVEQMMFFAAIALLVSLSIFWIIGSVFALIIVTIPGTYPLQALKISGDMVVQRRLAILFRVLWCVFILVVIWFAILIPLVLLSNWLSSIASFFTGLPIVQIAMVLLTSFSLVFVAVYLYSLYRKIIDYDRQN